MAKSWIGGVVFAAMAVGVPAVAEAQAILFFKLGSDNVVETALAAQGLGATTVTTGSAFDALLAGPAWDLVIVNASTASFTTTALEDYISAGGKAFVSYWNLDAATTLRNALGVAGASDFTTPLAITSTDANAAVWRFPNLLSSVAAGADAVVDDGDRMSLSPGSVSLASFPPGPTGGPAAALVAGNGGDTLALGHVLIGLEPVAAAELVENCIIYLLQKRVLLYTDIPTLSRATPALNAEGLVSHTFADTAIELDAALENGTKWDLVVIESAFADFGQTVIADYIANGGKAVVTDWNLDAKPTLRAALGVATATSFSAPQPLYGWELATWGDRIWLTPNALPNPIPIAADSVADNGDRLVVGSALGVGGYSAVHLADQYGVIIREGGNAVCISHDALGLETTGFTNLLQNCIHFLCDPPKRVLLLDDSISHRAAEALGREYLPYEVTDNPLKFNVLLEWESWDLVIVDLPSVLFDTGPLADFVNGCGVSIISYWALDSAPDLRAALEVTTAIDIAGPQTIYSAGATSEHWNSINPMSFIGTGVDSWFDNGDRMTTSASYPGIGYYTTTEVTGQIAVHDDFGDLVIGHDFDSLDSADIADWLENCIRHYLPPQPINSSCEQAIEVGEGSFVSYAAGYNAGGCSLDQTAAWYTFTAPFAGALTVSACGTDAMPFGTDMALVLYESCGGAFIAAYDDGSACPSFLDPKISTTLAAGEQVVIKADVLDSRNIFSPFVLDINFSLVLNDSLLTPILVGPGTYFGSLFDATADGAASCDPLSGTPDVWYFVMPVPGTTIVVDTCGSFALSGVDTVLTAYEYLGPGEQPGMERACNDSIATASGSPISCAGAQPQDSAVVIPIPSLPGGIVPCVLVRVSSAGLGPLGEFQLTITEITGNTEFLRGDSNTDGLRNIADAIHTLNALFSGGPSSPCADAADTNDDGAVNIADAVYLLTALFPGGGPPVTLPSSCGVDLTPDAIECGAPPACP
ncbi:MAG: hypothetical protein ACKVX7_18145 [Planctomycetota bacterium]